MSEFGITVAGLLDQVRQRSPARLRTFLRKQDAAVGLWNGSLLRLRTGLTGSGLRLYRELAPRFAALGDDPSTIARILRRWDRDGVVLDEYDALTRLVSEHPQPHRANMALQQFEMQHEIDEVRSLPWQINMDLDSVCNVQCRFCKYEHNHVPKSFLPIDHIRRIEWFRYISTFGFSAGTAESIIHPQFNEIFDYIRDTYPHLHLFLLTNGRGLTESKLDRFRDRLDYLYISMNASNREDYDRVIYKGDWDKFAANMRHMKRMFAGAKRPRVQANFVVMQWNIDHAVEYLEFAAEHGVHLVSYCHFYSKYIPDLHKENVEALARKFTAKDSLYYAKEKSDQVFERVVERARDLGVEVLVPAPFSKSANINFGNRHLGAVPDDCYKPWGEAWLAWGWKSRREEATICCGLAQDIGAFFDRDSIETVDGFKRFWNQPILRGYRRTANGKNVNPICDLCRKTDRFDPQAIYPDQRDFYRHVGLPIPEHFNEQKPQKLLQITSAS